MSQKSKTVHTRREKDVLLIQLGGREFVHEQSQTIADLVFSGSGPPVEKIVLDLTDVIYINSAGISVIIRMNLEKKLRLVGVSRAVRDILDLTGILPFISDFESVPEALADIQGGQA
jgi:anti-anti-sigma factor